MLHCVPITANLTVCQKKDGGQTVPDVSVKQRSLFTAAEKYVIAAEQSVGKDTSSLDPNVRVPISAPTPTVATSGNQTARFLTEQRAARPTYVPKK